MVYYCEDHHIWIISVSILCRAGEGVVTGTTNVEESWGDLLKVLEWTLVDMLSVSVRLADYKLR